MRYASLQRFAEERSLSVAEPDPERRGLERTVWAHTHADYRGHHEGHRAILKLDARGATVLAPLSEMSILELRGRAPMRTKKATRNPPEEHGWCCCAGDVQNEHECCPGWGHFNLGDDREHIERCDECARFDDDTEAARVHELHCSCGMGEDQEATRCHACSTPRTRDMDMVDLDKRLFCEPCAEQQREIITAIARTLWVVAYADFVDSEEQVDNDWPRAGPGEDWFQYATEEPESAESAASALAMAYERENRGTDIRQLLSRAIRQDVIESGSERVNEYIDEANQEFGHYLAMMAMGHGVSWFDDHATFELEVPSMEVDIDGEELWYSLEHRQLNPNRH